MSMNVKMETTVVVLIIPSAPIHWYVYQSSSLWYSYVIQCLVLCQHTGMSVITLGFVRLSMHWYVCWFTGTCMSVNTLVCISIYMYSNVSFNTLLLQSIHCYAMSVNTLVCLSKHLFVCQYTGMSVNTLLCLSIHWYFCQYTGISVNTPVCTSCKCTTLFSWFQGSFNCGECIEDYIGNQTIGCREMTTMCPDGITECHKHALCIVGTSGFDCQVCLFDIWINYFCHLYLWSITCK